MNFAHGASNDCPVAGIGVVVALHILLIYGLINGLARKAVQLLPEPIETRIIEGEKPKVQRPPPPPPPEFVPPPPAFIPPPVINIQAPKATTDIRQVTRDKPPPSPPPKLEKIPPRIDLKNSPRACRQPQYPSVSERLGESGTTAISLLVSAEGEVQQSKILESSGYQRLDQATIRAFSRCKFIVGTVNGKPEASWFSMRYMWVVPR